MPNEIGDEFAVGLCGLLGNTWWRSVNMGEGTEHNGAVPMERVYELLGFQPVFERLPYKYAGDEFAPVMVSHPNSGYLLGVNGPKYPWTGYVERLVNGLVEILDTSEGELIVGSAGILSGGRRAFVQIALSDPLEHAMTGEKFSQWLMAYSSLDGSTPNTFQRGCTRVQCRNTYQAFRREGGAKHVYRNTAFGTLSVVTARSTLDVFSDMGGDLFAQLDRECETKVSEEQWEAIKETLYPTIDKAKRTTTVNKTIHGDLDRLYYSDERVGEAIRGSQWGAFQALTTRWQHETTVVDDQTKLGRNLTWIMDEKMVKREEEFQTAIDRVLATV